MRTNNLKNNFQIAITAGLLSIITQGTICGTAVMAASAPDINNPAVRQQYIASYTQAIKKSPSDSQAYFNRGYMYLLDNKLQESLADLSNANQLKPKDVQILSMRARVFSRMQQWQSAINDISAASEYHPEILSLYIDRARLRLAQGEMVEATRDTVRAMKVDSSYYQATEFMGEMEFKNGKYADCIRHCNDSLAKKPDYAPALYFRGCAYAKLGDKSQAAADIAKAKKLGYSAS